MVEQKEPWIVWTGNLAVGGRAAEEFEAEVVLVDGAAHIVKRDGMTSTMVPATTIRADSWLPAFAALAKRVKELEASQPKPR